MTQEQVAGQFKRLEELLKYRMLPTSDGGKRLASVDEFMLMQVDGTTAGFKHRDSRNYVYVKRAMGEDFLSVPTTDKHFHGGTFDVFDV